MLAPLKGGGGGGEKKCQATPTKQGLGTSKGIFSKFPMSPLPPIHFIWECPRQCATETKKYYQLEVDKAK